MSELILKQYGMANFEVIIKLKKLFHMCHAEQPTNARLPPPKQPAPSSPICSAN